MKRPGAISLLRLAAGWTASWWMATSAFGAEGLIPQTLRTEALIQPLGLTTTKPRLSWQVTSSSRAQHQTGYQILVSTNAQVLASDRGDTWDSGKVESGETLLLPYGGRAPSTGERLHWKVRVWDGEGRPSPWSEPSSWGMGVVNAADWKARWISHPDRTPLATNRAVLFLPPARHYRKEFRVTKPVARAVVHFTALGLAEMHLNGRRIGDALFEPGWTDYAQRALVRTHDVTALMVRGGNCLGAIVADGWYAGYVGYGLLVGYGPYQTGRSIYGQTPAWMAQLQLDYADGTREWVATDGSWQVSGDGPLREADLIMGEAFDARREAPDWCLPGGARGWTWKRAIPAEDLPRVTAPFQDTRGTRTVDLGFRAPAKLEPYLAPPIRVTQEVPAQVVTQPEPGKYVFDLGQNLAGFVRLRVKGQAGTRLQLRHGEMLHPDGRLMTENLRKARATDSYTLRGDPRGETWQPRFTYHGFRYVEITGLAAKPGLDTVTGLVLHNDTPIAGEFECSDEVMTRFWKNTHWTQRANFIEMPTDCPQRDERFGWMGDAQVYVRTATFNADVQAFFNKWMSDVVEAQRDFGAYPDYAPYPMAHGAPGQTWGTAWTDAGIICPWTLWRVYADRGLLERLWPSMTRFMDWRLRRAADYRGKGDGNSWGDWLNVKENTPLEYIDAAYFALDARMMADMAEALGRADDVARYQAVHESVRRVFQEDYLNEDGSLKVDTQTAYAMAIGFRLIPEARVPAAAAILARKVEARGVRMATGFLGTKAILPALTAGGYHDLAVRLFQSRRYPSWGYEVVNGATTVWERWDSFTKDFGFNGANGDQNAAMNSFSHYAFGAVMEWAFRNLAGIDALEPGYRRIAIAPRPPSPDLVAAEGEAEPLQWVRAVYDSPRGRIESGWRRQGDRLRLRVSIPANTTARVRIPASRLEGITESGHPLSTAPGVSLVDTAEGRVAVDIGSGTYEFESPWR
ncbi:MAG: family 78 glycoside hydrolase catalytic domain [Verrucomicrobiales bacterium]|nr:family 78 glycoside hydrolase catalytic domain [Verrucomicrobiales bacterium]